ncbi:MAG: hypothetical protein K1Y36_28395 [Blastocatellia bacterium]|nr:hypothetical protein [Blastocatellia bacterium]
MEKWNPGQFRILPDGTVYAKVGTVGNCAGVQGVHARICLTDTLELTFTAVDDPEWDGGEYGPSVPGTALPEGFRQAVLKGVMDAYQESGQHMGVHFELLHSTHHPVDASERMFRHSAWIALTGWLEQREAETFEKPAPNPNQQE